MQNLKGLDSFPNEQNDAPQSNKKRPKMAPIPDLMNPGVKTDELDFGNKFVLSEKGINREEKINSLTDIDRCEKLGEGTSGIVYRGIHKPTNSYLAVKEIIFNFDETFKKRLEIELDTLISCNCLYIVKCYNVFFTKGTIHIAMEYMDRGTLTSILKEIKVIPEIILAIIAHQVLKGLEYLHRTKKIIHRDIKPSNLLVNSEGIIKIADFGVSGQVDQTLGAKTTWVGTSIYMSPERLKGDQYINDTDLWSLGLSLMECAIGKFPYEMPKKAKLWDLIALLCEKPVPKLPKEFSPEFQDFLDICLNKEAGKRSTTTELLNHSFVKKFQDGKGIDKFKGWLNYVYKV